MTRRPSALASLRIWHLALLVLFVAVAIANILDQRMSEPGLIALASAGFVLYGLLGCLAWRAARRWEPKLGGVAVLVLYASAMSVLYLVATVVYLGLEHLYRNGGL